MNLIARYKNQYQGAYQGAADNDVVRQLLHKYGITEPLYEQWLTETGGGPIGPDWYDGVGDLEQSQKKAREEGWTILGFVIGWDGAGNPIALQSNGAVSVEDHNFGGVHALAASFRELLANNVSS